MSAVRIARLTLCLLVVALGLVSCTRQPQAAAIEPVAEAAAAPAVPLERSVLLTYYSGEVDKHCQDDWQVAEIGDRFVAGESVRTGVDSFCELQVGQAAVVRLESETIVEIHNVLATSERSDTTLGLSSGSLLAKVERLSDTDRFRVKTVSAICGVRGTQFGVSVREGGDTLVSVKTGRVTVLPAAADVDQIKTAIQETAQAVPAGAAQEEQQKTLVALEERLDAIEAAAPVVEANQEVVVTAAVTTEVAQALVAIEEEAVQIAQSATPPEQEQIRALQEIVQVAAVAAAAEVARPIAISQENAQTLAVTDQMRLVEIPVVAETPGQGVTPQPAPAPRAVSVVVTPQDAEIALDGAVVARGSYHGLYAQGEVLDLVFRREGYKAQTLRITVDKDTREEHSVVLEAELRPVSVRATPADAEVVLDGKTVGTGRYTGDHAVGQRMTLTVQREGYTGVTQEITVPAAGEADYVVNLERASEDVRIQVNPAGAEILVNGKTEGTGTYTASVAPGTRLDITARKDGYRQQTVSVTVPRGGVTRTITLEVATETFTFATTPADAEIQIDGAVKGRGTFTGSYPVGTRIAVGVSREGYQPSSQEIEVRSGSGRRLQVTLQRRMGKVGLQVDLADARILRDGRLVGTGSYTGEGPLGEPVVVRVERLGYGTQEVRLQPSEAATDLRRVTLEPRPILWRQSAGSGGYTWAVAVDAGTVYVADKVGVLHALRVGGGALWSVSTGNSPNENSVPVLAGGTVYLSGSKELVAVDARTGTVRARVDLAPAESHIFGRRVSLAGTRLVVPGDDGLRLMDPATLRVQRSIPVRDGAQMSAWASATELYIANQQGVFLALDPESGAIRWEVATDAVQPIAIAPTVAGRRAYVAGRKGGVACVDLDSHRVVWQAALEGEKSAGVFQDLTVSDDVLLAYSKGTIYALNAASGRRAYESLVGASAPPLVVGRQLYYGKTDGSFVVADAATGRQQASCRLEGRAVTQPVASGDTILVGTDRGEVLQLLPEVILRMSGG